VSRSGSGDQKGRDALFMAEDLWPDLYIGEDHNFRENM